MNKFLQWLLLDKDDKLVGVKSWRPSWGRYGIEWPTLLYDRHGQRINGAPVWDWNRVRGLFTRATDKATDG